MAQTMNVKKKLAKARLMFLEENIKRSGKNMAMQFKYFELSDIVPPAIKIFNDVGLLHIEEFDKESAKASMYIYDTDDDNAAPIVFTIPFVEENPKYNKEGKPISNPLQLEGSAITYLRRYLYIIALDIAVHDDIEPNLTKPEEAEKKIEEKNPTVARAKAKEKLTTPDLITQVEIKTLKKKLNTILKADPANEDFVNHVAMQTEGFTKITRNIYDSLIDNLDKMIAEYGAKQ